MLLFFFCRKWKQIVVLCLRRFCTVHRVCRCGWNSCCRGLHSYVFPQTCTKWQHGVRHSPRSDGQLHQKLRCVDLCGLRVSDVGLKWPRNSPLPSNRHHRRSGDCLEGKGENYQVCSVQYCVQQLCTVWCTHMNRLTVLWIGFCLTGPISLCLDSFLYSVLLCVVCMRRFVTRWGGPGGIEAYP